MTSPPRTRRWVVASGLSLASFGCLSSEEIPAGPLDDGADSDGDDGDGEGEGEGDDDGGGDDAEPPPVEIQNPYAGIDWDQVEHHKSEFHNHPAKLEESRREEPHHIVDLYHGSGEDSAGNRLADGDEYTVYCVNDMGIYSETRWPWTRLSEIRGGENRDPEELGVVSFPGSEIRQLDEHVTIIFSTATDDDHDADERLAATKQILDSFTDEPKTLAVLPHPKRYYDDPAEEWTRYEEDFSQLSLDDGLVGFEILNKASSTRRFGRHDELLPDLDLWDHLLTEFMPERPIWGYGVDDPNDFLVGRDVDVRWTEILLHPDEFDPSDQDASRQAAMEAMLEGRVFGVERARWDHEAEDPPQVPRIEAIDVDGATISITASDYETIWWISNGRVIANESSITLSPDETPYVRAELWGADDESLLITQPFGVTERE